MDIGAILSSPLSIAVLTIVGGIAGSGLTLLVQWIRSRQGNFISVIEGFHSTGVHTSALVREKLTINYGGNPVTNLFLVGWKVVNSSRIVLEDVTIRAVVADRNRGKMTEAVAANSSLFFVEGQCTDASAKTLFTVEHSTNDDDTLKDIASPEEHDIWVITIHRPFFNPHRAYEEEALFITLISNRELEVLAISGAGPKWTARYGLAPVRSRRRDRLQGILLFILGIFSGGLAVLRSGPLKPAATWLEPVLFGIQLIILAIVLVYFMGPELEVLGILKRDN